MSHPLQATAAEDTAQLQQSQTDAGRCPSRCYLHRAELEGSPLLTEHRLLSKLWNIPWNGNAAIVEVTFPKNFL